MADNPILELEGGIGRIVCRASVRFPGLIPPLWHVRHSQAGKARDLPEEVLYHILPVTDHIDDYAAIVFLPVVPGRSLELLEFTGEYPISEFAPLSDRIFPKNPVSIRSST